MKPNAQKESDFGVKSGGERQAPLSEKEMCNFGQKSQVCLSQGSDTGPTADLDLESDDEGGDEGEEEVGVNDQDEEEVIAAAGATTGSGPDSGPDSAES